MTSGGLVVVGKGRPQTESGRFCHASRARTTVYLLTFLRYNVTFSLSYEEHVEKRKLVALVISSYQIKRPWHSSLVYRVTATNRLQPSKIPNCSPVAINNLQALITMLF